jgi:cytochrome c-type biogenesis protein CcmH
LGGVALLSAFGWWAWIASSVTSESNSQTAETVALTAFVEAASSSSVSPVAETPKQAPLSRTALREQAERYPRDGRGWALLAYAEFEANAYAEATAAFEKAVAVSRKVADDPGVLCDWADALGMAQGGKLAGQPTELISRALALRPAHPKALEMAGSAAYERREFALAADYWRRLLTQMPETSSNHAALANAVARAERLAQTSPPSHR